MKVLILGRANVGKSSLFNRLTRSRKSLVIQEPGITRDFLKDDVEWWGEEFQVIDSGGIPQTHEKDDLSSAISKKIRQALLQADVFVVIVDGRAGSHPGDFQAVQMARKTGKPFLLFVNKVDEPSKTDLLTSPFFELSTDLISGSFEKNYGVDDIVEWIISQKKKLKGADKKAKSAEEAGEIEETKETEEIEEIEEVKGTKQKEREGSKQKEGKEQKEGRGQKAVEQKKATKLFVIGRANSGKSLLCNQILKKDRMIVSSKSGTTLDTVTEFFSHNQMSYSISDNPGSRRGKREEKEKISFAKSRSALEKADIALLVLDVVLGPSRQDSRLVQLCLEKRKPVLIVVNKMDLLKGLPPEERKQKQVEIKKTFHFYPDLPVVFMSAKTGYHKDKLFKTIESLRKKIDFRVSTSELNNFFTKVIRKAPAPVYGTSDVKFYYINQTGKKPPEFIAFANYPKGVTPAYKRFIINRIKKQWDLNGIPIAFHALPKR